VKSLWPFCNFEVNVFDRKKTEKKMESTEMDNKCDWGGAASGG
jgi:hypothetical protein